MIQINVSQQPLCGLVRKTICQQVACYLRRVDMLSNTKMPTGRKIPTRDASTQNILIG